MLKISVNSIDFEFARNPYGTHNWCATDYNNLDSWDEPVRYWGNLEVQRFIEKILFNVDDKQQNFLYHILNLVNDSYIKSVGARLALCEMSYRESLSLSIGNRTRDYQLRRRVARS